MKTNGFFKDLRPENSVQITRYDEKDISFPKLNTSFKKAFSKTKTSFNDKRINQSNLSNTINLTKIKFSNPLLMKLPDAKSKNLPSVTKHNSMMETNIKARLPKINFENILLASINEFGNKKLKA